MKYCIVCLAKIMDHGGEGLHAGDKIEIVSAEECPRDENHKCPLCGCNEQQARVCSHHPNCKGPETIPSQVADTCWLCGGHDEPFVEITTQRETPNGPKCKAKQVKVHNPCYMDIEP